MSLLLKNVRSYSRDGYHPCDLRLGHGRILERGRGLAARRGEEVLDLGDRLALPGLINSHDHLGLNLFPPLGDPPYSSVYEWAEHVYHPARAAIRDVLRIDLSDRLWWGGYKNLISGVTTVVHHDPYQRRVLNRRFPTTVLRRYGWTHSLGYGHDTLEAHRRARRRPFILHAAEGTDRGARQEIDRLESLGVLGPRTVLVHGIGITSEQQQLLLRRNAAIVWCPRSNLRLYGATCPIDRLDPAIRISLGTDSTLTGEPTLLEELRCASDTGMVDPERLFEMVTTTAAAIFDLGDRHSTLEPGAPADIVILPGREGAPARALVESTSRDLELVVVRGRVRLADPRWSGCLDLGDANARIDGAPKWLYGDLAGLKHRLLSAATEELLAECPLWRRMEGS